MERTVRKIRRKILCYAGALIAALILSGLSAQKSFAAQSPGTYTVTVTPSYRDPVTGDIEDPGRIHTDPLCQPCLGQSAEHLMRRFRGRQL